MMVMMDHGDNVGGGVVSFWTQSMSSLPSFWSQRSNALFVSCPFPWRREQKSTSSILHARFLHTNPLPCPPSQCTEHGWTYLNMNIHLSFIPPPLSALTMRSTRMNILLHTSSNTWPVTMKCKWHDQGQKLWNVEFFLHCWLRCGTTCRPHLHYAVSHGMCDAVKQGLGAPKRVCVFQLAVPSYVNNFISAG